MNKREIKKPRVLVASPTYTGMKYCHNEFFTAIKGLTYPLYDILIIENTENNEYFDELKQEKDIILIKDNINDENKMLRLISSRNKILEYALKQSYDYVLMMDSDVIPPKNVIEELLNCKKDIVSGLYFNYFVSREGTKFLPVAWMPATKQEFENIKKRGILPPFVNSHLDLRGHLTKQEAESNKLLKVLFPSAGCLLISRNVIKNPAIRYGLLDTSKFGDVHTTDDIYFITKAREAGFDCFCYTKVKCKHLLKDKFRRDAQGNYLHPLYNKDYITSSKFSGIEISYNLL